MLYVAISSYIDNKFVVQGKFVLSNGKVEIVSDTEEGKKSLAHMVKDGIIAPINNLDINTEHKMYYMKDGIEFLKRLRWEFAGTYCNASSLTDSETGKEVT